MADNPIDLSVSAEGIQALGSALRAEEDGKQLRKELAKNMRDALAPAAELAKSGVMSMPSSGPGTSPGLRSAIAKKIRPEVKLGGRWTGARVKAKKTPGVRGFANAPKRTQRASGWRTQSWGNGQWRTQVGKLSWFDRAMDGRQQQYKEAVHAAMEAMARRIADRAGE
ncbi:hypothetical protein [Streptomyces sp. H39-C1]|uniref:hypothetical protein n=1 Tax=Streptomyces sp. H39-C1 TaxID=3004355 RepID=UPI0022B05283|nr:hypothetical protein [Streptomyces sp. H39-C1]MCZ4099842.1 hypothetical protein [Streptomyces sp. H39-C1]